MISWYSSSKENSAKYGRKKKVPEKAVNLNNFKKTRQVKAAKRKDKNENRVITLCCIHIVNTHMNDFSGFLYLPVKF